MLGYICNMEKTRVIVGPSQWEYILYGHGPHHEKSQNITHNSSQQRKRLERSREYLERTKKNEQPIHGAGPRSMRVAEFSIK
jgi:hypothetical protein